MFSRIRSPNDGRVLSCSQAHRCSLTDCKGTSFIELLVSLAIFSIGIVGTAQLNSANFRLSFDSLERLSAMMAITNAREISRSSTLSLNETEWREIVSLNTSTAQGELLKTQDHIELRVLPKTASSTREADKSIIRAKWYQFDD